MDDVSFTVKKGDFAAIVGTSGSGKTTLLNLIGGLDHADSGEIFVDGESLLQMKEEERTVFRRRKIGFIFQNYNLVTTMSVYKNIVLPVRLDGNRVPLKEIAKDNYGNYRTRNNMAIFSIFLTTLLITAVWIQDCLRRTQAFTGITWWN